MNEILISRTYLRFIKSKPCVVMHKSCDGPIDPHHLIARGWRESKRNDFTCIPLCRTHHIQVESAGVENFQDDYRINLWQENSRLLVDWIVNGQDAEFERDLRTAVRAVRHDRGLEHQLRKSIKVIRDAKKTGQPKSQE